MTTAQRRVIAGSISPVALYGYNGEALSTNRVDDSLITTDTVHQLVHRGHTFRTWYVSPHGSLLADNGEINIVLTASENPVHIVAAIAGGGDFEYYLFRGPTFNGGSALPVHNLNDASSVISTVVVVLNPTVTNAGTEIDGEFHPGGTGGQAQGGVIRSETEDVLRANTSYLFRVINRAGTAQQFWVELQWYED